LARRAIKRNNVAIPQLLIRFTNFPSEDASWEDYDTIASPYPNFILEDKNSFRGEGVSDDDTTFNREDDNAQRGEEENGAKHNNLKFKIWANG
jgi:hypothetical protein